MAKKKQISGLYLPSDPVYRLPSEVIDSEYLVERAMTFAEHARNDRMQWYQNRKNWLSLLDDYSSSIRKGAKNEVSNFHLPVIEPQIDAMRAQLLASIFFTGTPFHVSAGEDMDEVRVKKITNFMRYVVTRCANNGRGIYDAFYDFTTYLAMDGVGILSRDWRTEYYSYIDIDRNEEFIGLSKLLSQAKMTDMTEEEFIDNANKIASFPYKEVKKVGVNDYPLIRALPVDNVLFKGHSYEAMDLNSHDTVIEVTWFTKDQLLQMKSMGVFDEDVVDKSRAQEIFKNTGALAVAWEGAGGARACAMERVCYVEIRAITDIAGSDSVANFRKNLPEAMARLADIIKSISR